jgi:hypothetical protein
LEEKMSYELTLEQFENLNLFSNRNMEKVMTGVVNSSSNAALVNMGEDSVILLDHKSGDFYIADYEFDRKNLTLEFSNYERIDLIDDRSDFENDVRKVFESDDDEIDFTSLTESYKRNVAERDSFLNELVSLTMSRKSFEEAVDYDQIADALTEVELTSTSKSFFNEYVERIDEYPLNEVKRFDWINPVKVSLMETERQTLVNKSAIQKAHDLWKKQSFKEAFEEAAEVFVENVEEGTEKFKELLENYPQIYFLDKADRRTLFGKTVLGTSSELREGMDDLLKGIDILFEKYELGDIREKYLAEADDGYDHQAADIAAEEDDEEDDYEEAPEVEEEEMANMVDDLTRIAEKCEDVRTKTRLEDLIDKINSSIGEGTRPALVKEAVSILSL